MLLHFLSNFSAQLFDDRLLSVPRSFYDSKFGLQMHEYQDPRAESFKPKIAALLALKHPLLLLLTQREGRFLSLATDPRLYLRVEVVQGKLQWSTNTSVPFADGGHIWAYDFAVVHVHLDATCFFVGEVKLIGPDFLVQLQALLGLENPIPWDAVGFAGIYNDLRWFSFSSSKRGTGPGGLAAAVDTIERLPLMVSDRLQVLHAGFRKYRPSIEIIVVGSGLVLLVFYLFHRSCFELFQFN